MAVPFSACVLLVSWSHISCREMLFGEVLMPKTIVLFCVRRILKELTNKVLRECTEISVLWAHLVFLFLLQYFSIKNSLSCVT